MTEETKYSPNPTTFESLIAETTVALDAYRGHEVLMDEVSEEDRHAACEFITGRLYRLEDVGIVLNYEQPLTHDPSLEYTEQELEVLRTFATAVHQYRAITELVDERWDERVRARQADLKAQASERMKFLYRRLIQAGKQHKPPERPYGLHRIRWDQLEAMQASSAAHG